MAHFAHNYNYMSKRITRETSIAREDRGNNTFAKAEEESNKQGDSSELNNGGGSGDSE